MDSACSCQHGRADHIRRLSVFNRPPVTWPSRVMRHCVLNWLVNVDCFHLRIICAARDLILTPMHRALEPIRNLFWFVFFSLLEISIWENDPCPFRTSERREAVDIANNSVWSSRIDGIERSFATRADWPQQDRNPNQPKKNISIGIDEWCNTVRNGAAISCM